MLGCRTMELLALAVWIGGLVVIIGSVIPAVFNSFGMEPGGRFLTRVFDGYNRLVIGAIVILAGCAALRYRMGLQSGAVGGGLGRFEIILLAVMIAIAFLIMLWLGPASVTMQEQAFATKDEAARKAAYSAFFRTHTVVRGLYLLNLCLGIALVAVKSKGALNSSGHAS